MSDPPHDWTPFAGGDRLAREAGGGLAAVDSPYPKPGWIAPLPDSHHRPGAPGTAIFFEDHWYEVHTVRAAAGRTLYELGPWDDRWPIRAPQQYDAATCAAAARAHAAARRQSRQAPLLGLLAPLVGLLPARLQLAWEERCGVPATRATAISAALLLLAATPFFLSGLGGRFAPGMGAESTPFLVAAARLVSLSSYLMAESLWRLGGALFADTPAGSLLTVLPLAFLDLVRARRAPPTGPPPSPMADSRRARRATWVETFAPLFGLLEEPLQRELERRFPYSAERATRESLWLVAVGAGSLLAMALTWLASGKGNAGDVIVLVASAALLLESWRRAAALRAGEVRGSVLGGVLRPLARRLTAA